MFFEFLKRCHLGPVALAMGLLLSGCAVDPNNGHTLLDLDEVTATVIQPFPLAQKNGVLRRTAQGRYQLKLYDRNGVVTLPAEPSGFLVSHASLQPDGSTVLVLNSPRPNCSGHSYIYLLRANTAESRMIETNQCGPLDFQADAPSRSWLAQSRTPVPNGLVWSVRDGQLFSAQDPRQAPAERKPGGMNASGAGSTRPPEGGGPGWHIEHGGSNKPVPPPSTSSAASSATPPKGPAAANTGATTPPQTSRFPLPTKALEPSSLQQSQAVVIDIKK